MTVITNRLKGISRKGRKLTPFERTRYGKSAMLRYFVNEPIYPIGYVRHKIPMNTSGKAKADTVDEIKLKLLRNRYTAGALNTPTIEFRCIRLGMCAGYTNLLEMKNFR